MLRYFSHLNSPIPGFLEPSNWQLGYDFSFKVCEWWCENYEVYF